jgi:CubicO group peptidase (beta-lactamase class C family)
MSAKRLEVDATFRLESCTKLMTTVAALQCVEQGLLALDEDVTRILPELKDINILNGFNEKTQTLILVKSRTKLTLRFVQYLVTCLFLLSSLVCC